MIIARITIKLDRLIVLSSESSLLGYFLQVSLIVIIKGRSPMEVSLIVIIKQVSSWLSLSVKWLDNQIIWYWIWYWALSMTSTNPTRQKCLTPVNEPACLSRIFVVCTVRAGRVGARSVLRSWIQCMHLCHNMILHSSRAGTYTEWFLLQVSHNCWSAMIFKKWAAWTFVETSF